jgi:Protein of unknown function (DUF1566)
LSRAVLKIHRTLQAAENSGCQPRTLVRGSGFSKPARTISNQTWGLQLWSTEPSTKEGVRCWIRTGFCIRARPESCRTENTSDVPLIDPVALKAFSIKLASAIYLGRQRRGSERIPPDTAAALAASCGIQIEPQQLRSRSLLNRDAVGNLKFSHRSLMEYLFILDFLERPAEFQGAAWTDQMARFWWDRICALAERDIYGAELTSALKAGRLHGDLTSLWQVNARPLIELRRSPTTLTDKAISETIGSKQFGFEEMEDFSGYPKLKVLVRRFPGLFQGVENALLGDGQRVVIDHVTGLMWCPTRPDHSAVAREIWRSVANSKYAGYSDWRIPTFEEAASLAPTYINHHKDDGSHYPKNLFSYPKYYNSCFTADKDSRGIYYLIRFALSQGENLQIRLVESELKFDYMMVRTHNKMR